jgi:hypothetical protein
LSTRRPCLLLAAFGGIALAVLFLRLEQNRCVARLLTIDSQRVEQRRELWAVQTRAARLRTPQRVRDRLGFSHTGLVPAGTDEPPAPPLQVAVGQP